MPVDLSDADEVSRCIIFDRAFQDDVHVDEMLWRFGDNKDAEGVYHESAVLRRLAPEPDDVHRIGCGIAAIQNARKQEPAPGPKRRYYCGFRTAPYAALPSEGDGYLIAITNVPEGGEDAHLDVAVTITVDGKSARANRRTRAGLALADHFGQPAPHRCECDNEDGQHPFDRLGYGCLTKGMEGRWTTLFITIPTGIPAGDAANDQDNLL